jgi:hypothetical protein
MPASINDLATELTDRIKLLAAFENRGFYIYNMDDLAQVSSYAGLPLVAVSYEGAYPRDNAAIPAGAKAHAAELINVQFYVVVAIEYRSVASDDTKYVATDLLDGVRSSMLGYKGVNNRPWRLVSEAPQPSDLDGVIMYGQLWETDLPVIGTFVNQ